MNSTLKWAVLLLAFSLAPETALAGKKAWKHETVDTGDVASKQAAMYDRKPRKRSASASGARGDCGQYELQTAQGVEGLLQVGGIIVSQGSSAVAEGFGFASPIFGIFTSSLRDQAEAKRWGCFERKVTNQIAGIGKEMGQRLDQQDALIGDTRAGVIAAHEKIDHLKRENEQLLSRIMELEGHVGGKSEEAQKPAPPQTQEPNVGTCATCGIAPDAPETKPAPPVSEAPRKDVPDASSAPPKKEPTRFEYKPYGGQEVKAPLKPLTLPPVLIINSGNP